MSDEIFKKGSSVSADSPRVSGIAVDPGASGGIAWFGGDGSGALKMPKTDRILAGLFDWRGDLNADGFPLLAGESKKPTVYLEDLVKYTGRNMPSSSMATYAGNWGFIKGVLTAFGYRIVLVPPKAWQKALGLGTATGMTKTQWKNKIKQRAEQLYPSIKVTLATADALLILEAAKRGLLG